jgi:hypothetical protein
MTDGGPNLRAAVTDVVTLPVRLAVAATEVTLGLGRLVAPDGPVRRSGGYAERAMLIIGEGGLVDRLAAALTEPNGPMSLVRSLAAATADERPLGRAIASGGTLDRLFAEDGPVFRVLRADGLLDRLFAEDGPLERLVAADGALDRVTRPGGALDRLLEEEGLVERLLIDDGFVDRLVAEGGTLDQLIALGSTLERIVPRLEELSEIVPELHESVNALNRAVEPLGELVGRLPKPRRRVTSES